MGHVDTSSSGPSSDLEVVMDYQSQRTSPPPSAPAAPPVASIAAAAAPPQDPDTPTALAAGVHPDFLVPPVETYARYTIEDLLTQPGKEGMEVLDPDRPPNIFYMYFFYFYYIYI